MNEEFIIILANGKPVLNKLSSNLRFIEKNNIEFFPSGMVKRFKFKGIFYIALFYTDSNKLFAYYFNETEFNHRKSTKGVVTLNTSNLEFIFKPEWFINAKTSHNGLPIEVEREYNHDDNLCIARYQLIYNFSTHNYNQNDTVPFPPNYDHSGSVCFSSTNPLMKFYSAHVNRLEIEKKVLTRLHPKV